MTGRGGSHGERRSWAGANWAAPVTVGRDGGLRVYPYGDVWIIEADTPLPRLGADVDHATHAFGLAVPSGIISTTGVGGLTLGELPPGEWRALAADEVAQIFAP